ncbi:MAG: DEAD/DEAH box helicase family protein [Candidatus Omnitrophota bacterium]|jgi:CRISPR-associated endonuclease/helicase Cas3
MNSIEPLAHSAKKDRGIPVQSYADHVAGVVKRAEQNVSAMVEFFNGGDRLLGEVIKSTALMHDLGKLDEENQRVLNSGGKKSLPINHVDAGTAQLCQFNKSAEAQFVQGHHIGLCSIPQERARDKLFLRDEAIYARTNALLPEYIKQHERYCGPICFRKETEKTGWSALTRRLAFSCLVDADYGDTAYHYSATKDEREQIKSRWEERLTALDSYVAGLSQENPDGVRNSQRQKIYRTCRNADMSQAIYACDSPVGTGKTTAVMAYLLRVAQAKKLRHIFVVLPYTNIIKQSVEIYRKSIVLPGENPEEIVTELHHQADFSEEELRQYAVLWTAPIVVTTAVQFFETLSANHPARLRKLHALPGSAIFLDEAHAAIPTYLWPQAWKWIEELTLSWRCYFVLASGSLPQFWLNERIVSQPKSVAFILPNDVRRDVHEEESARVIYKSCEQSMNADNLIDFVYSKQGPRLVIVNTVQSAAVLASKIKKKNKQVIHLSTALTPKDRNSIIERIKTRLNDKEDSDWVLVATSCVEAGMDLSFATAFREHCSAASLIQIGGRVNRHSEKGKAEIWSFKVVDSLMPDNPQFGTSQNVLSRLFKNKTIETKNATEAVTEAMRLELMSDYGDFSQKAEEIIKREKQNDFPEVAKLGRVIDADTRTVIVSTEIADSLERHQKVNSIDIIRNSVQIRFFKIDSAQFKWICRSINGYSELYKWEGRYDGQFLGYMEAIIPLIEINNGYGII